MHDTEPVVTMKSIRDGIASAPDLAALVLALNTADRYAYDAGIVPGELYDISDLPTFGEYAESFGTSWSWDDENRLVYLPDGGLTKWSMTERNDEEAELARMDAADRGDFDDFDFDDDGDSARRRGYEERAAAHREEY